MPGTWGDGVPELRERAAGSSDAELVGRWALAEMVAPGGDAANAAAARKRLDQVAQEGLYPNLARGIADEAHGEPKSAADAFVAALRAAQGSADPDAPLAAWVATHHLFALRGSVADLYARHRATLEGLLARPENLGWRATADLGEWWATEVSDRAEATGPEYDALVTKRLGCAAKVRLAGPFGHGSPLDRGTSFPAERPGPWPVGWAPDPRRAMPPHVLKVEQHRCYATSAEAVAEGIYYAETFFTTAADREVLVAVQGAVKVWIDDVAVLERDPREWGSWQHFGAAALVKQGRHRILARVPGSTSSIRIMNRDGTAASVETDADAELAYAMDPPKLLADPNLIDAIVRARAAATPVQAFLASYAAHMDGMNDVAALLAEPLVATPVQSGPIALQQAALYAASDPALPEDVRQRTSRSLRETALSKDARLWDPRMRLILEDGEHRGLAETVDPLRRLADQFKNVPIILEQLSRIYARLGWSGERMRALADLATRFPDAVSALRLYLDALDTDGALADADKVAARIKKLEPDAEVDLDRALARHDWRTATAELQRLAKRRPERTEIAGRIADVLARAGDPAKAAEQLNLALAKQPQDALARFRLADRAFAKGDTTALRRALAESLQVGADGAELRAAIDLLEGATDLQPYRLDGRAIIKEFEAWEKAGHVMEGHAARVLDYSAVWVHPDGSSEMLEHEIQRIQSQEAVARESEVVPSGLILRLRVIKPDGSTLEPERIERKPSLTLPHLEVGDYIDLERIIPQRGDGQKGRFYQGPQWFFREPDKGYWRSEFVVVSPKDKPLDIEQRGEVGQVKERTFGTFIERRWRVDQSPPAPSEDGSPPATEFYPNLRISWGISLADTMARLAERAVDDSPLDPRLAKVAFEIVRGVPKERIDERARLLYRYVADHIQENKDTHETDGRRVLNGLAGSRQAAFQYLLRQVGISCELAAVKNKLALPPIGNMTQVEAYYDRDTFLGRTRQAQFQFVLRVQTEKGPRWLLVGDKYSPYGFVRSDMRGQQAFRLIPGTPTDVVTATGPEDAILYEGRGDLRTDGSASLDLALTVTGADGIGWRQQLDAWGDAKQLEQIEKSLIAPTFDGGHVRDLKIENRSRVDAPLVVRIRVEAPRLAKALGANLSLPPVFPFALARFAALPQRQTPLLRPESLRAEVHFVLVVPESMRVPSTLPTADLTFGTVGSGASVVSVKDSVRGHAIYLDRSIDMPSGRVQPGDEYARYHKFVREADALLEREILLGR